MNVDMEDRFLGAILGCACGDATGAPYEGMRGSELCRIPKLFDPIPQIPGYPKGQYTDDTQLTLALAETYIACACFDGDEFGTRIAELWRSHEIVGAGASCSDAAYRLIAGIPWRESGTEEGRAGNGTAMRASPVGLWNHDDLDQLKLDSRAQSIVTHKDPRAQAGAAAVAWAVAQNLREREIDPGNYSRELSEFIRDIHEEFAEYILQIPGWLKADEAEAKIEIACAGWLDPKSPIDFITPFVIPSVLVALYYFLKMPLDFSRGLDCVIRSGGDVDTTGAIFGAISGAKNGVDAIPDHLRHDLYQADRIEDTARRLSSAWKEKKRIAGQK
jgi:ADP-ribosyl-[dinitrogen reductase] hydrolase